jgi:acyl carrier protein
VTRTARDVSLLLSGTVARVSGRDPSACADRGLRLAGDLGIDSLALAEIIEDVSAGLGIVIPDEDAGRVRVLGDLQDLVDARVPGLTT